ncbi:MAG TPA: DUF3488 and transglutaminase-like domain-containing protein [Bryobacteraceae bacterium]|nr:DUF3488 and transglutaminase-like domain-containing protein [Bryobacteraceae bacterium]
MARASVNPQLSVERFFQLSVLGLVTSGYLAVAGSGFLDVPTIVLTGIGLAVRALLVTGLLKLEISDRLVTWVTVAYIAFYPVDYFFVSRGFLQATVHLVFYLAVMKILTARTNRDYLFTAVIAFLEILAAAILSASLNFLVFLGLYLLCAIAAFTSAEIRRAMQKPLQVSRSGLRRFHPRLAALAVCLTCGILVLTAGLFFMLPRGPNASVHRLVSRRMHLPGFSNEVSLDDIGEIKNDSSAVMHVRRDALSAAFPQDLKWRGITLSEFDGKRWFNPLEVASVVRSDGDWALVTDHPGIGPRLLYTVALNSVDSDALFIAGQPVHVQIGLKAGFFRGPDDSLRLAFTPPENFRYSVSGVLPGFPQSRGGWLSDPGLSPELRAKYLKLPAVDSRVRALAGNITAGLLTEIERARAIERHLASSYGYTLVLPDHETADPIAYFLFERKKGHCEYFASAMTVMLRTIGIPARLVNGFQSGTYNPFSQQYVIRASDAHSWVEAYLAGRGWTAFDPTPADPKAPPGALMSRLALWADAAETFWQDWVLRYDLGRQLVLAERLQNSTRGVSLRWMNWSDAAAHWAARLRTGTAKYGAPIGGLFLFLMAAILAGPSAWRALRMSYRVRRAREGRASAADATVLYLRMLEVLRRRGFQKPEWFTPREFAASLPAETGMLIDEFTAAYNDVRFGGKADAAARLTLLLEELETGRTGIPAL